MEARTAPIKNNPVAEQRIRAMVRIDVPRVPLLRAWRNYLCDYVSPDAIVKAQPDLETPTLHSYPVR